jgi:hypothetical protein
MTGDELLGLSSERDAWLDRVLRAELRGYQAGRADGYELGDADGYRRAIAEHKAIHRDLQEAFRWEIRRWGPGGRTRFADPRPGDFKGTGGAA